jgi:hypothetical protein
VNVQQSKRSLMRSLMLILAGALVMMQSPALAGMITVPVQGTQGYYFDDQGGIERSAAFTFDPQITRITEVRVRLTGVHAGSSRLCLGIPFAWNFFFEIEIYDAAPGTGFWTTASPEIDGVFIETMRLGVLGVSDWSFLLDGSARIRIQGYQGIGQGLRAHGPAAAGLAVAGGSPDLRRCYDAGGNQHLGEHQGPVPVVADPAPNPLSLALQQEVVTGVAEPEPHGLA